MEAPAPPARSTVSTWAPLAIGVFTLLAYFPALRAGLIWNDADYVTAPRLRSLSALWRVWTEFGATQQYYPLLHSAFWLEHRLWGDSAFGYHLANVAFHALAAILLGRLLSRQAIPGAWLAAAIFALHPIAVESVAWISEQKNTLSTVFYLGAAARYLSFDQSRRTRDYLLALALFVAALLTKSVTATLPGALLVWFWWRRERLSWQRDWVPLLPLFALGAAFGLLTGWIERHYVGATGAAFELPFPARTLVASHAIWFYLGKALWPAHLIFIYPRWTIDPSSPLLWIYPLALAGLAGALWHYRSRSRAPLAALLFFVSTLFPILGFFNVFAFIFSFVADHWQYLADLGLIVPFAAAGFLAARKLPANLKWLGPACAAALLLACGILTWRQSRMYRDMETFYRTTLAGNPDCWMAHNNLATLLAHNPATRAEAWAHEKAALRLKPHFADAHNNLGNLLSDLPGQTPAALAEYQTALRLKPNFPEAHYNFARLLGTLPGRGAESIAEYEVALRYQPDYPEAENNLGAALASVPGRQSEAVVHYENALREAPDDAPAHNNLGGLLAAIPGRETDALRHYEAAIRLQPNYVDAHFNLGSLLARLPGRRADAVAQFQTVVRLQPADAQARQMLAALKN